MSTEADVRRIALSLPETTERTTYGDPGFRVRDRVFAVVRPDGLLVLWVADLSEKAALLAEDPAVFSTTPHYDGHASVRVDLAQVDVMQLAELLTDGWRARYSSPR